MKYFNSLVFPDENSADNSPELRRFRLFMEDLHNGNESGLKFRKSGKKAYTEAAPLSLLLDEWLAHPAWKMPRRLWLALRISLQQMIPSSQDNDPENSGRILWDPADTRCLASVLSLAVESGLSRHHSKQLLTSLMALRGSLTCDGLTECRPELILNRAAFLLRSGHGGSRLLLDSARVLFKCGCVGKDKFTEFRKLLERALDPH